MVSNVVMPVILLPIGQPFPTQSSANVLLLQVLAFQSSLAKGVIASTDLEGVIWERLYYSPWGAVLIAATLSLCY